MLENFVKHIADKTFVDEIVKQFQGSDLAQCGNCGSIKIDAGELAKILINVNLETEFYDYSSELLSEITEGIPAECLADAERWDKWDKENEYRRVDFLTDYDTDRYLKFKDVLIIADSQCQCFRKEKCPEDANKRRCQERERRIEPTDERILDWLKIHEGQTFRSPRVDVFGVKTYPVMITEVNEGAERVKINFVGGVPGLPLFFWMFDRSLTFIQANRHRAVMLGARVRPPFDPDTVEGKIWEDPHPPPPTPYKAGPHVCDLLVLAGLAKYERVRNPRTNRTVQGVKYSADPALTDAPCNPTGGGPPETTKEKEEFIKRYGRTIIKWTRRHKDKIVSSRARYAWKNKSTADCVRGRNVVWKAIVMSRIKNGGAVDLDTLDEVMMWGFDTKFPMRDPVEVLKITKEAFDYLDGDKLKDATKTLLTVRGVGISRASKILGLFDQENLCIYDSRVGKALAGLKHEGKKVISCPPGRTYQGDQGVTDKEWATHYQRLIWTLEIVRDYFNEKGQTYRLADVEMALFMIGKGD